MATQYCIESATGTLYQSLNCTVGDIPVALASGSELNQLQLALAANNLDAPVTIQDHIELSWLVVLVLIVGASVAWIKRTLP